MADRLGLPVGRLKEETTSSEFVKWQAFLALQQNSPDRSDYYMMQVAQLLLQIIYGLSGKGQSVALADMKIPFVPVDDDEEPAPQATVPMMPEIVSSRPQDPKQWQREAYLAASKANVFGALGIGG